MNEYHTNHINWCVVALWWSNKTHSFPDTVVSNKHRGEYQKSATIPENDLSVKCDVSIATVSMAAAPPEILHKLVLDKSVSDPFSIFIQPCGARWYRDDVNLTVTRAPAAASSPKLVGVDALP